MIYIHRDWSKVPDEAKAVLKKAADELDAIADDGARKEYIKNHSTVWAAVREYLSGMSHGKCWYSEAKEAVSRYHVDHFRPHGRAKQSQATFDEGYSWLAFDLDNFRLAGMLCNTINKEFSDASIGKGEWFPLSDATMRASLQSRSISRETPILLDPTDPDDPYKLCFNEDGNVVPDPDLSEPQKAVVEEAIGYFGLRQSRLNGKRRSVLRSCYRAIRRFKEVDAVPKGIRTDRDIANLKEARGELLAMSAPTGEFAAAVRCLLIAYGLKHLISRDELKALALEAEDA